MVYRTKTYIAGDWTGDKDAIDTLYKWKNSGYLNFDFVDAHSLTQARDTSLGMPTKLVHDMVGFLKREREARVLG